MEKKICCCSLLIATLICSNAVGQTSFHKKLESLYRRTVPFIYTSQLKTLQEEKNKIVLLDIRAAEEYDISHIADAQFMDYRRFNKSMLTGMDLNTPVVVYCSVGVRSEHIGQKLIRMGFKDVRNLYGGIFEWMNQGNQVVDNSGKTTDRIHTYNKSWSQWVSRGVIVY